MDVCFGLGFRLCEIKHTNVDEKNVRWRGPHAFVMLSGESSHKVIRELSVIIPLSFRD